MFNKFDCFFSVVFSRYTIVMIYYAFGLVAMMLVRPILSSKFVHFRGTKSIYAALYFFPILVVIQAVFAGLLCMYNVFMISTTSQKIGCKKNVLYSN